MGQKYEFKILKINDLEIVDFNPNEMSKSQIAHLKKTIKERGFMQPITVTPKEGEKDKYVVIDGAHRLNVFKELQRSKIPCYIVPDKKSIDIKIDLINLNKIKGEFNQDKYNMLLESIMSETEIERMKDLLNLEKEDLKSFETFLNEKNKIDLDPELVEVSSYERAKSKTKIKLGDIYQLGNHRLMCGDSTKESNVNRLMDDKKVDLLLTDPPYGISIINAKGELGGGGKVGFKGASGSVKAEIYPEIKGDDVPFNPKHILNFECNQIIFGANHFSDKLPCNSHWLVWDKRGDEAERTNTFSDAELMWTNIDKKTTLIYRYKWSGLLREGSRDLELKKRVHPTQKPVGLITAILTDYSKEHNLILDLYAGSGSILLACEQINRKCFMMEIDPVYCQIIIDRWQDYTSNKAVNIDLNKST